jgi:dolichyl-phosphate-mannose--protein O-mannosyl transferase
LICVATLSFGLRFWHLDQFNSLVFDEVYYVKFAQSYLAGVAPFDAHPPLAKYLIAAGIWLSEHSSFELSTVKTAAINSPISYRWMNALVGSLVPLIVVDICWHLDTRKVPAKRWTFSLLAGLFAAIDGLFITESRYALINIYMVFFGLLSHCLWLRAAQAKEQRRVLFKMLAGVLLGAAAAVKWNGLGYWLSLLLFESWRSAKSFYQQQSFWQKHRKRQIFYQKQWIVPTARLVGVSLLMLLTYCLIWWPHLHLTQGSIATLHQKLLMFHSQLTATHPACAKWYTWPLLIKPISYWYVESEYVGRGTLVQSVNNLGNPALWGFSAATVLLLLAEWRRTLPTSGSALSSVRTYLLIGYLSNWLPWAVVERCTYNYLFMPAAVFGFMALALAVSEWLCGSVLLYRVAAGVMLGVIAIAFLYWLPLSLGLPLTPQALQNRWWLRSWI